MYCDRNSWPVRSTPALWSCGGWHQCCCYCLHAGRLPSLCARWDDGALPAAFYCIQHTMRCFGMPYVGVMTTLRYFHRLLGFVPYGRNLRQCVVDDLFEQCVEYQASELVRCLCVFYSKVLINWSYYPWTEIMVHMRAHSFSFHGPFCSGHTDNLIRASHICCYLRPQDVEAVCGNLACIMTLNDVSHGLLPSIARDLHEKFGYLFCDTRSTDNGK